MKKSFILIFCLCFYSLQAEILKEFDANGLVKSERNYIKKMLRSEKYFFNGKKEGIFKTYFSTGVVETEISDKNDQLDGCENHLILSRF